MRDPHVILLTPSPGARCLELLYAMWLQSRNEERVVLPEAIAHHYERSKAGATHSRALFPELYIDDPGEKPFHQVYDETIDLILSLDVPLIEAISFTFVVEDMPISLREQLVRHREGSFWLQSGRIRDQRTYAELGRYYIPVADRDDPRKVELYEQFYRDNQEHLKRMLTAGIRIEDARNILPSGQTHRGAVTFNYRTMKRMIGKRTSFIAQNSMWGPLLTSLAQQIALVDPRLVRLFEPPPLRNGRYIGDPHKLENLRRLAGDDPLPPDPIFMKYEAPGTTDGVPLADHFYNCRRKVTADPVREYLLYASRYVPLWGAETMRKHGWLGDLIVDTYQEQHS